STVFANYFNPPTTIFPMLPAGTYDIMTIFNDVRTRVVNEGVSVGTCPSPLTINSTDAIYDFTIDEEDYSATNLPFMNLGISNFVHAPSGIGWFFLGGFAQASNPEVVKVNGFSNDYQVDMKLL